MTAMNRTTGATNRASNSDCRPPRRALAMHSLVLIGLLGPIGLAPQEADAQTCSSVTIERPDDSRIGTCYYDPAKACSSDSQCGDHKADFCLHGVSASNSSVPCYTNDASCQSDITFELDAAYECGQFVTGDWWVKANASGRVGIRDVTPRHTPGCEPGSSSTCMHGWQQDQPMESQSLSNRTANASILFNRATPSLPHTVQVGSDPVSLLKVIDGRIGTSTTACANAPCLMWAGALTVVPAKPPADAFRPPYAGPGKPNGYYTAADVDFSKLPSLDPDGARVSSAPSVQEVSVSYSHPWVGANHRNNLYSSFVSVYQSRLGLAGSGSGYHASRTGRTNDALLRMTLDDMNWNDPAHRLALYRMIQLGIDHSWIAKTWTSGYRARIKNKVVPISFASVMLEDPWLRDDNGFPGHSEQDTISYSRNSGLALFGSRCSEDSYWKRVMGGGDKWCGDPYGWVDQDWYYNSSANSSYQYCCSSATWKGGALLTRIMGMEATLDADAFLEYTDRWVERGFHNAPDMCAKHDPRDQGCDPARGNCAHYGWDCSSGDCTWGPAKGNSSSCHEDGSCQCIGHGGDPATDGRLPSQHGKKPDGGLWGRSFSNQMWDAFRECVDSGACSGGTGGSSPRTVTELQAPTLLD